MGSMQKTINFKDSINIVMTDDYQIFLNEWGNDFAKIKHILNYFSAAHLERFNQNLFRFYIFENKVNLI